MRRTRINPVSKKRRQRDASYGKQRLLAYDRAGGLCEARSDVCTGRAEACHHIAGRLGADPHRLTNLLVCCRACHDRIHAHPAESRERGWMKRRVA